MSPALAWFVIFDAVSGDTVAVMQAFDKSAALYTVTLQRRREGKPTVDLRAREALDVEIPARKAATR